MPKDFRENLEFRRIIWSLASDPGIQEELRIICSRDILFELNVFGYTLNPKDHPRCPTRPFITYEYQDRVILSLQESIGYEDIAFPKSRDMGCSECCLRALEHPWRWIPQQQFLLTSEKEELVESKSEKALMSKLDYLWRNMPKFLLPNFKKTNKARENLENGSKFVGTATVPNLGRGDRPTAILNDEAAEQNNAGEIASATRDATNCRIYNSTPNGRFGTGKYFFDIVKNPGIKKIFVHWSEHPVKNRGLYRLQRQVMNPGKTDFKPGDWITEREVDKARRNGQMLTVTDLMKRKLDPKTYNWRDDYDFTRLKFHDGQKPRSPWYDKQCIREPNAKRIAKELDLDFEGSTEKLASGLDMETLRQTMVRKPLYTGEVLPTEASYQEGLEHLKPVWLPGAGFLELWCDLPEGRPPVSTYSIGADISGGTGGDLSSQSVLSVWDNVSGEQVAEWRSSTLSPDDFAIRAVVLAKFFHDATLVPEINGPGGTRFINKIIACQYWNVYRRSRSEIEAVETKTSKLGWFSSAGPESILSGMFAAFANGLAKPRSEVMLAQVEEYEWSAGKVIHKASASNDSQADKGKAHGDAAVAGALGWLGVETAKVLDDGKPKAKTANQEDEYPEGSIGWRRKQREIEQSRDRSDAVECQW